MNFRITSLSTRDNSREERRLVGFGHSKADVPDSARTGRSAPITVVQPNGAASPQRPFTVAAVNGWVGSSCDSPLIGSDAATADIRRGLRCPLRWTCAFWANSDALDSGSHKTPPLAVGHPNLGTSLPKLLTHAISSHVDRGIWSPENGRRHGGSPRRGRLEKERRSVVRTVIGCVPRLLGPDHVPIG
jgi:hypothetical protein